MNKKLSLMLFIFFMLFFILYTSKTFASTNYNDSISYIENDDGTIAIQAVSPDIVTASIPSQINGKTVTTISDSGFKDCKSLEKVELPDTINSIEQSAFSGCSSLSDIIIPSNVTLMGNNVFSACSSLKTVVFNASINVIPQSTFYNCISLDTISFPDSSPIKSVGKEAFAYCSSLKTIILPLALEDLQRFAFSDCASLEEVYLPKSFVSLDTSPGHSFFNCNPSKLKIYSYANPAVENYCNRYSFTYIPLLPIEGITLSGLQAVNVGERISLEAIITPTDAFLKRLSWSSSNEKIATVDSNGTITGMAPGKTTISATSIDGTNISETYEITVFQKVTSISISGQNSTDVGNKVLLTSKVLPSNADNPKLSWTSSNTNVATIDQSGIVTAKNPGSVTITATSTDGSNVKATYKITVNKLFPFIDVSKNSYYYSAVKYCYNNGIIAGTSDTTFSPNSSFSRVMLVTILWRMEGCPRVNEPRKFTDVPESAYYYNAVQWAASKKVVSGYGEGKFKPNNSITREQLAVMLRNYAIYKGKKTDTKYSLDNFEDNKNISSFAKSAMQWAVEKKIMSGSKQGDKTMLNPKGTATRAQAAVMVHNFCLNIK